MTVYHSYSFLIFAALFGVAFQQHRLPCRKTARQETVAGLRRPQLSGGPAFPSKDTNTHTHARVRTYTETFRYFHAAACKCLITDTDSCCSRGGGGFSPTHLQQSHGPGRALCGTIHFFFFFSHTHSRDMNRQHIEMIIKALWDGWILGQVECAHSHLQNEHLLSSDRC